MPVDRTRRASPCPWLTSRRVARFRAHPSLCRAFVAIPERKGVITVESGDGTLVQKGKVSRCLYNGTMKGKVVQGGKYH